MIEPTEIERDNRTRRGRIAAGLATVIVLALTSPAIAATYYVRASGSDAQDGLTPETALASIRLAGRRLLAPGDRVIVGPGTYFEGNIEPYGSGTPDAPIVFSADEGGLVTHDPPGPVIIRPPNTFDATTGFIVFGKHDIVIEGFTIEGSDDAGIQVRPHSSTGVESTRITVRDNRLKNGARRGLHVVAVADVTVIGNSATGNTFAGLALIGSVSAPVRPLVRGNFTEENGVGIALEAVESAVIADNTMRSNKQGFGVAGSDGLTIARNNVVGSRQRAFEIDSGRDVELEDNQLEGGARLGGLGSVVLVKNWFFGRYQVLDMGFARDATVRLEENILPFFTFVSGGALLELRRNNGSRLRVGSVQAIVALDNEFKEIMRLHGIGDVEVSRNRVPQIQVSGLEGTITDNEIDASAQIYLETATVTGNRAGTMVIDRLRSRPQGPSEDGPFVVERNEAGGSMRIGRPDAPVRTGLVQDNTVARLLRISALDELLIRGNETAGIDCGVLAPKSQLSIVDNTARGGRGPGIVIRRVHQAVVERNVSSGNQGGGLMVHRFVNLSVTENDIDANEMGGVLIQAIALLGGDCDGNGEVTVAELIIGVGIALGQRPLSDCAAVDFDGDEATTLDELVRAVGGSLGAIQPDGPDATEGSLELRSNAVEENKLFGIRLFTTGNISARDNVVLRNERIGLAVQSSASVDSKTEIDRNVLGSSSGEGLLVEHASSARITNNRIFSNGEAGILLRDAPGARVANNLIYDNGDDGIAVGRGTVLPAPDAAIMNNTLYANRGFAVTIGSAGAPSTGAMMLNNILDGNAQGGVASDIDSLPGLTIGYNLNNDGYSNEVEPSVTDFTADPRFVSPEGADRMLGGDGFADDDFHVRADEPASAAIDAGSATAAELGITGSAVQGQTADDGVVDLGFHYDANPPDEPSSTTALSRL